MAGYVAGLPMMGALPVADALTMTRAMALVLCQGGQFITLIRSALMLDGVPGETARQNVLVLQAQMRAHAESVPADAAWIDPVIARLQHLLDAELMRRANAIRAAGARRERTGRLKIEQIAGRAPQDALRHMVAKGSLTEDDLRGADEIRAVIAEFGAEGWAGRGALDPAALRVDGGRGWSGLPTLGGGRHPATDKVFAWLDQPQMGAALGQYDGATLTVGRAVLLVVCRGISCATITTMLKVRKSVVNEAVVSAIKAYEPPPHLLPD